MITAILYVFGTGLFLLYLLKKLVTGGQNEWKARGFEVFNSKYKAIDRILQRKSMEEVDKDIYQQIKEKNLDFGVLVELRSPTIFVTNPELLKKIAIKDFEHFSDRRAFVTKAAEPILSKILINMNGPEWKGTRSILSPTFTTGKIRRMFEIFETRATEVVKFLKIEGQNGRKMIDTPDIIGRCTMDVIASAAFGVESNSIKDKNATFTQMGKKMQKSSFFKFFKILLMITAPKIPAFFKMTFFDTDVREFFIGTLRKVLKHREETKEHRGDFLQLMIEAKEGKIEENKDELNTFEKEAQLTNKPKTVMKVDDDLIIAQAFLFLFAGFDSTESAMLFTLYELALNPHIQEKLFREVKKSHEDEEGKFTYDSINKMDYLDRVVSESLRKHSPAFRTERKCVEDYLIPDTNVIIPKGTNIALPIQAIHHDPEYWPNPTKFDPDRFLPEEKEKRSPYAYLPFGHGPRNCIGMRFALMEAKTVLAEIVFNFSIEPCEKTAIPIQHSVSGTGTKPKNGLFLNYVPRTFK